MPRLNLSLSAFLAILSLSLVSWPSPGKAAPITQYEAYASAASGFYYLPPPVEDSDSSPTLPVKAEALTGVRKSYAHAFGTAFVTYRLEARARAYAESIDLLDHYASQSSAFMTAEYVYVGLLEPIEVSFDYTLDAYAQSRIFGSAEANAVINASLRDLNTAVLVWEFKQEAHAGDWYARDYDSVSGSVEESFMPIAGHSYALHLDISQVEAIAYSGSLPTAFSSNDAHALIDHIQVTGVPGVPVPATFYLLSSGLVGLLGWRMMRKNQT